MDDQEAAVSVRSNPHWAGDPSRVRGPASDGSYIIPARALHVTWGNDPRYWEWVNLSDTSESKLLAEFEEGAMLQQVNWLEVTGKFELGTFSRVARSYKVYCVMKFNADAFGWGHAPVKFKLKLQEDGDNYKESESTVKMINLQRYAEKSGTWHKIYVGEFKVVGNATVEFGMLEVETDWWKGSMLLAGILLEFIHPN